MFCLGIGEKHAAEDSETEASDARTNVGAFGGITILNFVD
jgi:hypothetical protein